MLVNAHAVQIRESPNPRAYHIYLAELHWISFDLLEVCTEPAAAHRQLRSVHDHLSSALGPATFSYPDYSHDLPAIFWEREPLMVAAGPHYGSTRLKISIQHTPTGYDDLKAEAARIRAHEGDGARVDFVAWHEPFDR